MPSRTRAPFLFRAWQGHLSSEGVLSFQQILETRCPFPPIRMGRGRRRDLRITLSQEEGEEGDSVIQWGRWVEAKMVGLCGPTLTHDAQALFPVSQTERLASAVHDTFQIESNRLLNKYGSIPDGITRAAAHGFPMGAAVEIKTTASDDPNPAWYMDQCLRHALGNGFCCLCFIFPLNDIAKGRFYVFEFRL